MIGPPGCGKGTQGAFISHTLGIPSVSTGEILRHCASTDDALALRVRAVMESGALVSDEIVNELVAARTAEEDCARGFVLDGYPRTVAQARYLSQLLSHRGCAQPEVLVFDVRLDPLVGRLTARRYCPLCGRVYNLVSAPPAEDDFCDDDGMCLVRRADDEERVIRDRFAAYEKITAPVLRHYRSGTVHRIDGGADSAAVSAQIESVLHT